MQHGNNNLEPLRLPCVWPDCAPLRWGRCGAFTAQFAESSLEVGSQPKEKHGRELRLDLSCPTQGVMALHHPFSLLKFKTYLILSDGCKCASQCHQLAWVKLWERMLRNCQHNLSRKFSWLRNVEVALKFSFCWGAFFAVCISDAWVGVFLF